MTRARVVAFISHANALLKAQDCQGARQAIGQAWLALGDYSAELAKRGVSPSTALELHRTLSKALVNASKRCGVANPNQNELVQPSSYYPSTLQGVGDQIFDSVTTTLATLGIAAAVFGISYGFWQVYKGMD